MVAGVINLLTAIIHLIGGQIDLVNPLLNSDLSIQQKGEFVGVWHMVSILLCFTSYLILRAAFQKTTDSQSEQLKPIAILYLLCGLPFIISSIYFGIFAPQWILLMPVGGLILLGIKRVYT